MQQLLTMQPRSQSVNKAAKTKFEKSAGGILGKPTYKNRKKLPQSTLEAVAAFYKNDEYTRVMPSKSDCVMLQETC